MSKRVLIIGGGVIGLCTAYYCARRGFEVTVVERNAAQRDGCSFGNAGMVVPSHFVPLAAPGMVKLAFKWMWNPASPLYVKPRLEADLFSWGIKFMRAANAAHVRRAAPLLRDLSLASRTYFEEFAALPYTDFGLVKKGLLMLCQTNHALDEEAKLAAQANALGVPAQVLDAKHTAALDPNIRMDIAGAVYFPMDCHLTTKRFMAALEEHCGKLGVRFVWSAEVRRLAARGKLVAALKTEQGEFDFDELVMCGGSWSPCLARTLGLKIPMQAGKGYSLTLPKPRQLPEICSICTEARVAVTPMDGALRVGGTMEIAGLNEDINPVRVRGVIDSFCNYFPEFRPSDFDGVQPWRGLRPCSPDGLPYIGRTSKFTNLSVASGHGMMGLSLAPITGKLMGDILSGEKPAWDISMLSPDRYS
ncbi:MAG TPA: FAD-dependent oxidoreductase [Candidatus Binatia bacterium]|nr:FAD-dependent oxidoreductase [Candidatus Binatia bacterium]